MKVLITPDAFGYRAQLLECNEDVYGRTYDDALYNLQSEMARRIIDAGTDNVFEGSSADSLYWDRWLNAESSFYSRASFYYEGKPVHLPVLDVRVFTNE